MIITARLAPLAQLLKEQGPSRSWRLIGGEIIASSSYPGGIKIECEVDPKVKTIQLVGQTGLPFRQFDVTGHKGRATVRIQERA